MNYRLSLCFIGAIWLGACSFDEGGPSFSDAGFSSPDASSNDAMIAVDADPSIDASVSPDAGVTPDALVPVCDPGGTDDNCSDGNTLQTCRGDGSGFDPTTCAFSCLAAPNPHCSDLDPSNGITSALLDAGDANLSTSVTGSLLFNTNNGEITDPSGVVVLRAAGTGYDASSGIAFQIVNQPGDAPDIGVFSMASLTVAELTELRGAGNNAMAIATSGAIQVNGVIQVTGGNDSCLPGAVVTERAQCSGPGGFDGGGPETTASGAGGGAQGNGGGGNGESGGGGGGHGGAGGPGGNSTNTTGGIGGIIFANTAMTPLTGGGGGGGGANELSGGGTDGATGAGGGGGLQVISRTSISFGPNLGGPCGINAGGGGASPSNSSSAGGGGGAGGGILLEAPSVILNAQCTLAANGGAGSGGDIGLLATTGLLSAVAAPGGSSGVGADSGDGGDGAAGGMATGSKGDDGDFEAGGGGGGIGAVRVNTLNGSSFTNDGTNSPASTTGVVGLQ